MPQIPAAVTPLERGQRAQRMREYAIDRDGILQPAIAKAAANGFVFDADLPNKHRDQRRQEHWTRAHIETPASVYLRGFLKGIGL